MTNLFTNLSKNGSEPVNGSRMDRHYTENGPIHSRQLFAVLAMLWVKLVNLVNFVMQIFKLTKLIKLTEQICAESLKSLKSLKSLMQIFATSDTSASANFVGKASCESTVRYREWSRIPSCYLRSASVIASICFLGVGEVWGATATLPFYYDGDGNGSATGLTLSSIGKYDNSPKMKFDAANDYLTVQFNSAPAYVSFTFKQNGSTAGTFKVQQSTNGSSYTDAQTVSWPGNGKTTTIKVALNSASRYVKLIMTAKGSSTNAAVGQLTIKARTTVTLDKNGGSANGSAIIAYDATAKESITAPTNAGSTLLGYWEGASTGNKVLNADGSFAASSVSGWITSNKWTKDAATAKLYARWEAACDNNVNISKGSETNGTFTISKTGSQATCSGLSVVVTPTPSTHYHVASVTATTPTTGGAPTITGPSDGKYTVAYAANSTGSSTINVAFEEDPTYTVTWVAGGNSSFHTQTSYAGTALTAPGTPEASTYCPGGKVFVGWTTTEIVGTTDTQPADLFTSVSGMSIPATNKTYYAVFATSGSSSKTYSFDISASDFNTTSYVANNNQKTSTATATDASGATMSVSWTSNQVMKNSSNMQWQKDNGYIYNSTDLETINSVTVTSSAGTFTTYYGTTSQPSSGTQGTGKGYFKTSVGNATGTTSNVAVNFTKTTTTYSAYATSCCTPLASINGSVKVISGTSATLKWDVLSNVDGTTPYTVTVSPSAGTTVGGISTVDGYKNCTITGLTAGTEYTFTINAFGDASHCNSSQEVVATTPKITLGSASGTSTYIEGYGPGSKQTFTVTAVGLTGNLTVTAPTNFAVCATENGTYTSSITLTPTSGAVSTTVYFRLVTDKTAASSPYAGNITVSGGSATEQTVAVNGTVSPSCHTPTISGQPAASASYNMNVTATALSVTAAKGDVSDPTLTYQWYSNTANSKTTPTPSPIDGATSSSYTPPTTASGTKYYFCEVSSGACAVTSNISAITVNTPTITVSETSRAFGDRAKDGSYEMTFTVSGSTLAKDAGISLAISGTNANLFSIDKTSLSPTSNAVGTTTITVTYSPNVTGSHSAQIDITSTGATTKTVTLSGTSKNQFTITLNPGNGSLSATGSWTKNGDNLEQTILDGTNVTLVAPTPGCASWEFVGWKSGSAANNDASFSTSSPNRDKTATFAPEATTTYYAVYQLRASGGTTYNKITSTDDLTTGNYVIKTSSYAMKNDIEYGTYWHMKETYNTESGSSLSSPAAENIWEIIKFGSYYIIKNGTKYVGLTSDGDITFDTNSHLFSASYSSSQWTFTSATYATKQIIYNSYFRGGTAQSTSIMLYKQGSGLSGNFFSNPSCSSYTLTGVASPSDSYGTVALSATSASTGSTAYALATPKSGYAFSHWTISGAESTMSNTVSSKSYDNPVTITMGTANTTITAHFEARVPVTFNTPAGVDAPSSSYKDVVLPSVGLPAAVDDDCWEFAGWTEETSWNDEDAPTLYAAGTRYSGDATSAFNLYAVYKRVVFEQVYDADDLEAEADYVISKYSNPNEYAIKAEVSNTTKAASTNIIGKSQEISTKEYYYYFIHNPASYNIWHLTGSTDAWQLTNGDLYINLSDAEGAILQGTAANMKITEGTGNNAALFSFQDATTATNYLGHSSTEFLIDDEATYFYLYKTYSSLYMTSPSEPTYTITWKVSGQDDEVQTITQCAGLTDSDIPSAPADNTLNSCVTSCKFVGWTETPLTNATDEEPDDLFLSADNAPMIRGNKTFYAVFANGSNIESDVINYSATSSKLGSTSTSSWVDAFDITGTTGAVYRLYSMGTTEQSTYGIKWNKNGYLYCKTAPTSGRKLLSVSADGSTSTITIFGSNTAYAAKATDSDPSAELSDLTMSGTYKFSDTYQYIGINGTEGSTTINTLTITYGTYTGYRTSCCETPTFTISGTGKTVTDGKISFPVLREDLGGASTSTWAELPITISSNSSGTITIIEGTGGDAGKTAWKLSSWESRAETGGTIAATGHATFTSPSAGNYLFKVKTTTGQTGQGTYRIGIHQAADATYCEATYYLWVDVTMRDKFVDNVNGNATINVDTHGATTTTPTEASLDADKNDDCHSTTRRFLGWVREDDMNTWYVTGNSTRVSNLDDKKEDAKLVAPGATITTSGATWYAVWGEEVTE